MAEEMIGTSNKVQDSFKKENHTYMIRNFTPREEVVEQVSSVVEAEVEAENTGLPELQPTAPRNNDVLQHNIEALRARAIHPQPVAVQVDFQTPQFDARQEIASQVAAPVSEYDAGPSEQLDQLNQPNHSNQVEQSDQVDQQERVDQLPASSLTEDLAANFQVNIPGVDTNQPLNSFDLSGASHTPQAVEVPTREKDDFISVRLEASSEQTTSRLQAEVQPRPQPQEELQQAVPQPPQPPQQKPESQPQPQYATQQFSSASLQPESSLASQESSSEAPQELSQEKISNPASQEGLATGFPQQQTPAPQSDSESASQPTSQSAPEQKRDLWTPEERKLKEDCDLSKVFNFSGK
ncbi:hypothetical protein K9M74_00250 [Candidatus Woesearchaeota archaeon]|nr:hypothetical protein [Candidatus Woesearchaeota archaeon]